MSSTNEEYQDRWWSGPSDAGPEQIPGDDAANTVRLPDDHSGPDFADGAEPTRPLEGQGYPTPTPAPVLGSDAYPTPTPAPVQPDVGPYGTGQGYAAPTPQSYGPAPATYGSGSEPYGSPAQPYGSAPQPYGSPAQPYGSATQPYGPTAPYGAVPQPYGQPAYGQQGGVFPYGQPYPYGYPVLPDHPNSSAIFGLGIASFAVGLTAPIAWYLGSKARKEIAQGAPYKFSGLAMAGWIIGIIYSALMILFVGFFILLIIMTA